ncbi:hypothetical protein ABE41_011160 [Fictibacillus arsenicus]|uniref:DUF3953 domain-containing protein n=1 Tax=Fictibacillus arsenicus TaxID=255247 RepID=A0A1B1Z557_9BACL|nr:hypothetical protein [Fictibacillus arsenicus]ANX12570.1 hypothetical protein ABE41_011160 [Fictibacillus arsenicus]
MKVKSKVNPKIIILFFSAAAIVVGNKILKASGIISLFIFITGIVLIFLGTWKLLYSHKTNKFWLNGLLLILAGLFIVFLSMWLPSILFIFN